MRDGTHFEKAGAVKALYWTFAYGSPHSLKDQVPDPTESDGESPTADEYIRARAEITWANKEKVRSPHFLTARHLQTNSSRAEHSFLVIEPSRTVKAMAREPKQKSVARLYKAV